MVSDPGMPEAYFWLKKQYFAPGSYTIFHNSVNSPVFRIKQDSVMRKKDKYKMK